MKHSKKTLAPQGITGSFYTRKAKRAINPERDSPAALADASILRNTRAGSVMFTRSALSDNADKSISHYL